MTLISKLPSFLVGVATTVLAFSTYANLVAQSGTRQIVDVCANVAGTLRLTEPTVACEPGERRIRLRQPEIEDKKEDEKKPDDRRLADLQERLGGLEERASKGRLFGSRVIAPFEVINEDGYAVFKVEDGYVWFNNASGTPVARVVANDAGGYFEGKSTQGKVQAIIGAVGNKANVFIQENDQARINLGRNDKGQYGLRVYEPGGKLVAGIGQATSGDGVVTVADTQGNQRAAMYVQQDGGGILDILNAQGKAAASLLATEAGNGRMQLFNKAGETMVEAGVTAENVGRVSAGPAAFHPGVGILGLPGSYIAGKAAK